MSEIAQPTKRGLFEGFQNYLAWWLLLGAIGGLFTVVAEEPFWVIKAWQVAWGLMFGALCACIFTALQNLLNASRKRWATWVIAFVVWMGTKFLFALPQFLALP